MFPGLAGVFLQDLVKKKYPHADKPGATAAYEHDDTISEQIALTWTLLEASTAEAVVIFGDVPRLEFVERYGEFVNGDSVRVGNKDRRIYHTRHPQHTAIDATVSQLKELRRHLEKMFLDRVQTKIDFAYVDKLIEQRTRVAPPKESLSSTPPRPSTSQSKMKELTGIFDRSAFMRALYEDPQGPYKDRVQNAKRAWKNGAHEGHSSKMKEHWADGVYDRVHAGNSEKTIQKWKDGVYGHVHEKIAEKITEHWDKGTYDGVAGKVSQNWVNGTYDGVGSKVSQAWADGKYAGNGAKTSQMWKDGKFDYRKAKTDRRGILKDDGTWACAISGCPKVFPTRASGLQHARNVHNN